MNLTPPADRVLLRQLPPETVTAFGLAIPEVAQERPLRAEVIAVGAGTPDPRKDGGTPRAPIPVGEYVAQPPQPGGRTLPYLHNEPILGHLEVGDEVIIPPYGGTEIELAEELGGGTVISILGSEILARVG